MKKRTEKRRKIMQTEAGRREGVVENGQRKRNI